MIYYGDNLRSFQQIHKQHDAHVLVYRLHKMDFQQLEMRALAFPLRPRNDKMDSLVGWVATSPTFSSERVAASVHEAWLKANPEKHDAHVKAYHNDFLNQLLSIYKRHWMQQRDQFHIPYIDVPTQDEAPMSSELSDIRSRFWEEYSKDNFFSKPQAQTTGAAEPVSVSFLSSVQDIDNKLEKLGLSPDGILADYMKSYSYLTLKMLKARPKNPAVVIYPAYDFVSSIRCGKENDMLDCLALMLGSNITGSEADMAGYSKNIDLRSFPHQHRLLHGVYEVNKPVYNYFDDSYTSWYDCTGKLNSAKLDTAQSYKKPKQIPNNIQAKQDQKAKLLAKNKFFRK